MSKIELPKGIDQELYDSAKVTIVSGFDANQDADTIKSALFSDGVPFSKLAKVFNAVTKNEGLVVDMKSVKEKIVENVKANDWSFEETYEDVASFAGKLLDGIKGATKGRIASAIKAHFIENEKQVPRKVAPKRGRIGAVNKALINVFAENKKATEADCVAALEGVVKTEANAISYAKSYHKMLYAAANGLTALEVLTVLSEGK